MIKQMMSGLLVVFAVSLFTQMSFAKNSSSQCQQEVLELVRDLGSASDDRRQITDLLTFEKGEAFQYSPFKKFGPFSQRTVVALVSGSHHSGYFVEAYFLDSSDCSYLSHDIVYSE